MHKTFRSLLFAVALVAGEAHGGEFGNVLGTPLVDERSRQASAQALEGIIKVLNAIRLRELRNPDQRAKELSEAVAALGRAHEMMKAVRLPPDLDKSFDLKGLPQPYQGIVENAVRRMGRQISRPSYRSSIACWSMRRRACASVSKSRSVADLNLFSQHSVRKSASISH